MSIQLSSGDISHIINYLYLLMGHTSQVYISITSNMKYLNKKTVY